MSPRLPLPSGEVRWTGGGLLIRTRRAALWIDAGPAGLFGEPALVRDAAIVLTSARTQSVGGLLGLLDATEPLRPSLIYPLGGERVPLLVSAWSSLHPERQDPTLDGIIPGQPVDVGELHLATFPLRCAEAVRQSDGAEVHPVQGMGVQVHVDDLRITWIPASAPGTRVERYCRGSQLAVIQVAALPYPSTERPWRATLDDAIRLAEGAEEVWLVGDDGRVVGPGETH